MKNFNYSHLIFFNRYIFFFLIHCLKKIDHYNRWLLLCLFVFFWEKLRKKIYIPNNIVVSSFFLYIYIYTIGNIFARDAVATLWNDKNNRMELVNTNNKIYLRIDVSLSIYIYIHNNNNEWMRYMKRKEKNL